jgi:excisionase family DNA binding protein
MNISAKELMTVNDFCVRYSVGRTTLYREVNAGRLKLRKLGIGTRIAKADADEWANRLPVRKGKTP